MRDDGPSGRAKDCQVGTPQGSAESDNLERAGLASTRHVAGVEQGRRPGDGIVESPGVTEALLLTVPPFDDATVTSVAKAIGELYSGSELARVLAASKLMDIDGAGTTKWKRLYNAIAQHQNHHRNGRATVALIHAAMAPGRTLDRIPQARLARDELNQALSLAGLAVAEDGRLHRATRARTDAEAHARASRLRAHLEGRGVHQVVLDGLREEWLRGDYYDAVFESIKLFGHRLRSLADLDLDGHRLVDAALLGPSPRLLLNDYATATQKNEQRGVAALAQGLFSAVRNPQAHEPRSVWSMTEQDALDILATLSLVHRRLDAARVQPEATTSG